VRVVGGLLRPRPMVWAAIAVFATVSLALFFYIYYYQVCCRKLFHNGAVHVKLSTPLTHRLLHHNGTLLVIMLVDCGCVAAQNEQQDNTTARACSAIM